jgi:hypothetical protein
VKRRLGFCHDCSASPESGKEGGFILLESGSGEGKVATERSGKVAKDNEKQTGGQETMEHKERATKVSTFNS